MQLANLKYSNPSNTAINMDVTLDEATANQFHAAGETIPYTYVAGDTAPVNVAIGLLLAHGGYAIAAYAAPPPPDAGTTAPRLVASAFNINVAGGDIPSIDGVFNIAAAIYLGVGQYMVLFLASQPDGGYFVAITGGAPCMTLTEKNVDYVMVEAHTAVGGDPVDPTQFGLQVYRA
jgi:hypothetical protein